MGADGHRDQRDRNDTEQNRDKLHRDEHLTLRKIQRIKQADLAQKQRRRHDEERRADRQPTQVDLPIAAEEQYRQQADRDEVAEDQDE